MSSTLLLQQFPACLVRLILIVFVQLLLYGVLLPGLVQYCSQHSCVIAVKLFLHTKRMEKKLDSNYTRVHVVHPYSSIDTTAAWKKLHFILSVRFDFHMTDRQSTVVHARRVSMSVSVDERLLPRWVNLSTRFRELPFSVEMSPV